MSLRRVKVFGEIEAVYHCMSRIVGGERWLQNSAKEDLAQADVAGIGFLRDRSADLLHHE